MRFLIAGARQRFSPEVFLVMAAFVSVSAAALIAYFSWQFFLFGTFRNDIWDLILPKVAAVENILSYGQLPLWSPYEGLGVVLFPLQSLASLDLYLALKIFTGLDAIHVMNAIYTFFSLLLFYLFARELALSRYGAAFGAFVYVFNLYYLLMHLDMFLGYAMYIPLVLFAFLKWLRGDRPGFWLLVVALGLAAQWLDGRGTTTLYFQFLIFLFFAYAVMVRHELPIVTRMSRLVAFGFAVGVVSVSITVFFLVPYAIHMLDSWRMSDAAVDAYSNYERPANLLDIFVPGVVASLIRLFPAFEWLQPFSGTSSHWVIGIVPLPFVIAACMGVSAPNRYRGYFMGTSLLVLAIVLPLGIFDLLREIPGHGGAREPVRFLPMLLLCVAALAAIGFDKLFVFRSDDPEGLGARTRIGILVLALAVAALVAAYFAWLGAEYRYGGAAWNPNTAHFTIGAVLFLSLLTLQQLRWQGVAFMLAALAVVTSPAIVLTKLMYGDRAGQSYLRNQQELSAAAFAYLQHEAEHDLFRVLSNDLDDRLMWPRLGLQTTSVYLTAVHQNLCRFKIIMANEYCENYSLPYNMHRSPMYDLMNVKYFLYKDQPGRGMQDGYLEPPETRGERYPVAFRDEVAGITVHRNPKAFERVFFVSDYAVAADDTDHLAVMTYHRRNNFDWFRSNAVLDREPEIVPSGAEARVVDYRYTPLRVTLRVEAETPSILVLGDRYDPSWRATVNGEAVPVLQANYIQRGIALDAGRHVVEFRYRPTAFLVGAAFSAVALLVVLVLTVYLYRRPERSVRWIAGLVAGLLLTGAATATVTSLTIRSATPPDSDAGPAELPIPLDHLYEEAVEARREGEFRAAVVLLEAAVGKGHVPSMRLAGEIYLQGWGSAGRNTDVARGLALLEEAAASGDVEAALTLATVFTDENAAVEQDLDEAIRYLSIAADHGHSPAFEMMAEIYASQGRDRAAFRATEQAAKQGVPQAMFRVAEAYRKGEVVEAEEEAALHWYSQAADFDYPEAKLFVIAHAQGGVLSFAKADPETARELVQIGRAAEPWTRSADPVLRRRGVALLQQLAEAGNREAMAHYGNLILQGRTSEPLSVSEAVKWLEGAGELGSSVAPLVLAELYAAGAGDVARDPERAAHYFQLAADRGRPEALAKLGTAYIEGWTGEPDPRSALRVWREAFERYNRLETALPLIQLLAEGVDGIESDMDEAIRYASVAAESGDAAAMAWLSDLLNSQDRLADYPEAKLFLLAREQDGALSFAAADPETAEHLLHIGRKAEIWTRSGKPGLHRRGEDLLLKLAKAGNREAKTHYGNLILQGRTSEPRPALEGVKWLEGASELGASVAPLLLGELYRDGASDVAADEQKAVAYLKLAVERGRPEAFVRLGEAYMEGWAGEPDPQSALRVWRKAFERYGTMEAAYKLGLAYRDGLGVAVSLPEARRWLQLAADHGSGDAQSALAEFPCYGDHDCAK